MPATYNQDAVEICRKYFCEFGGNADQIEKSMRRDYPGWRKQNLYDRGGHLGWINKYGFEKSLKLHLQKLTESVNNDEEDLYLGIKAVRKAMQEKMFSQQVSRDELYQYRDFCKLEIDARRALNLSSDNFETFVAGYEKLIGWLSEIDRSAVKILAQHGKKIEEMAMIHYGVPSEDEI